jgi:transcriptional regulator with XRE-family HTH domain
MDLVQIRTDLNLTQAALAAKIGVSPGYVADIERGHRKLTIRVAALLEAACECKGLVDAVVAEKRSEAA